METQSDKFDTFAIVEVFGHQKFAGRVTEQAIGGASFVRVDVPKTSKHPRLHKMMIKRRAKWKGRVA